MITRPAVQCVHFWDAANVHSPLSTQSSFSSTKAARPKYRMQLWYFHSSYKSDNMKIQFLKLSMILKVLPRFKTLLLETFTAFHEWTKWKYTSWRCRQTWNNFIWKMIHRGGKCQFLGSNRLQTIFGRYSWCFLNFLEIFELTRFDWQVTKLVLSVVTVYIFCWLPHWVTQASF